MKKLFDEIQNFYKLEKSLALRVREQLENMNYSWEDNSHKPCLMTRLNEVSPYFRVKEISGGYVTDFDGNCYELFDFSDSYIILLFSNLVTLMTSFREVIYGN